VKQPLNYYAIVFDPDAGNGGDPKLGEMLRNPENRMVTPSVRDHVLVDELEHLFRAGKMYQRYAAEYLLTSLIFHWYGMVVIEEKAGVGKDVQNLNKCYIERAVLYLNKRIDQKLNVEELAGSLGLSPEHVCRIFHKEIGMSPLQYMTRLKIDAASQQLIRTNNTLEQIAEDLGYADQFHFSHTFKKYTGISPTNYRQINSVVDPYTPATQEIYPQPRKA
jgi:AraC-like DNA-binding protein